MAEETLFSRDRDEAEGRQARIDRLFADAVERQMVEHRSSNRVMEDVGERLASLESGLRSLRETTSSHGLALRAELQEGLANVAEDVDTRARSLAGEVERLRVSGSEHAARLGELSRAAEQAIGALGEGQARLADELVAFERNVAALTEQTAKIPDLVAPQLHRLEEIVAEVEGHVRSVLDSGIRELDQRVANLDGGLGDRLEGLTSRLDERLAVLTQRLDAIEQRVDSHEEAFERATSALAGQVTEALEASEQRRTEDAADAAQALRTALSERIHVVETRLDERFSGLGYGIDERLAELASVMSDRIGQHVDAARDAVDESREALAHEILNLSSRLRHALVALGEASARDAAEAREAAAASADQLGEVAAHLAGLEEDVTTIMETPSRTAAATIDGFRPFLENFRSSLVAEQREELASSLGQVRTVTSGVVEEIEELQILASALRQAQTEDEERLEAVRGDLLARVEVLLTSGLGDIRHSVDERVVAAEQEGRVLRSVLEERLDVALETLRDRFGEMVGMVDERLPDALKGHREDLVATLEQFEVNVVERLSVSEEEGRALRVAVEERVDEAVSKLEERRDVADEVFRTAIGKLDDLAPDLDTRIARALDRAVDTARREARSATGELHAALARLAEIQAMLTGIEGSLVAYLGAFDTRLERERARVLSKLGEELADGLSRRERKRLVGRLSSTLDAVPSEVSSSPPSLPPLRSSAESRPERSLSPGLLRELLGEESTEAQPEPVLRMLRAGDEEQTAGVRTEKAPHVQEIDTGLPVEVGRAHDEDKKPSFLCPTCGFVARSAAGLASHRRRHA